MTINSLADLNDEMQAQITELAKCFFVPKEIALMLEIDEDLFMSDYNEKGKTYRAFNKGFLQAEFDLRKCILALANSGSSPAQTMAIEIRDKAKVKLLER